MIRADRDRWLALALLLAVLGLVYLALDETRDQQCGAQVQALAGVLTMPVVAFVLVGNTVFGLLAGGLFARHGLEAAIIAHVLAHLLASPLL